MLDGYKIKGLCAFQSSHTTVAESGHIHNSFILKTLLISQQCSDINYVLVLNLSGVYEVHVGNPSSDILLFI